MIGTAEKVIRGNMGLPLGAKRTGRSDRFGNEIFTEEQPVLEVRQAKDAAGDPLFQINKNTGHRIRAVMEQVQVGTRTVSFTLDDLGNGIVTKNYGWEPDPEEELRAAARENSDPLDVSRRLARIEAALAATGLTVADAEALADVQERRAHADAARAQRDADIAARREARRSETPEERAARLQAKADRRQKRGVRGARP